MPSSSTEHLVPSVYKQEQVDLQSRCLGVLAGLGKPPFVLCTLCAIKQFIKAHFLNNLSMLDIPLMTVAADQQGAVKLWLHFQGLLLAAQPANVAVWTCCCGQKRKHICFIVLLRADFRLFFFFSHASSFPQKSSV